MPGEDEQQQERGHERHDRERDRDQHRDERAEDEQQHDDRRQQAESLRGPLLERRELGVAVELDRDPGRLDRLANGVLDRDDGLAVLVLDRLVELRLGVGDAPVVGERVLAERVADARDARRPVGGLELADLSRATAFAIAAFRSGVSSRSPSGAAKTRLRTPPCSDANSASIRSVAFCVSEPGIVNSSRREPPIVATSTISVAMMPIQAKTTRHGCVRARAHPARERARREPLVRGQPLASSPFSSCSGRHRAAILLGRVRVRTLHEPRSQSGYGPQNYTERPFERAGGDTVASMPRRNRVTPFGELVADPAAVSSTATAAAFTTRHGRDPAPLRRQALDLLPARVPRVAARELLQPGTVHRALLSRRGDRVRRRPPPVRSLPQRGLPDVRDDLARTSSRRRAGADAIDARLHDERVDSGASGRACAAALRGAVRDAAGRDVRRSGRGGVPRARRAAAAVDAGRLRRAASRPRGRATVLTPPSLVEVLREGWEGVVPLLHPSARQRPERAAAEDLVAGAGSAEPRPFSFSHSPTRANSPGAYVSERSISEVRPVFVSTSAWFAFGKSTTVMSRPGSAAIGASRRSERPGGTCRSRPPYTQSEGIFSLRIHGIGSTPPGPRLQDLRVDLRVRERRRPLALAGEILVEVVLVGRHGRAREDEQEADRRLARRGERGDPSGLAVSRQPDPLRSISGCAARKRAAAWASRASVSMAPAVGDSPGYAPPDWPIPRLS